MGRRRAALRGRASVAGDGPLDHLADVGPVDPPAIPPTAPAADPPIGAPMPDRLDERKARWFEERERFERRRAAADTPAADGARPPTDEP